VVLGYPNYVIASEAKQSPTNSFMYISQRHSSILKSSEQPEYFEIRLLFLNLKLSHSIRMRIRRTLKPLWGVGRLCLLYGSG